MENKKEQIENWFLSQKYSRFGITMYGSFTFIWGAMIKKWYFVFLVIVPLLLAYLIDKKYAKQNK